MQFNQSTPGRSSGDDDHLIPLINIVFLMLIFFMIAGQIVPTDALDVQPPISDVEQPAPAEEISLLMDREGRIALNGETVALTELSTRLQQVMAPQDSAEHPQIALKVDAELPASELSKLLDALREAKAAKVTLFTMRGDS